MKPYYQDKYATIYHGDCLEILPEMPKVDLVLTDPPYGINTWNDRGNNKKRMFKSSEILAWDIKPTKEIFDLIMKKADKVIIWGGNHFLDYLGSTKQILIWDKELIGMHFNDAEIAWCNQFKEAIRIKRYSSTKNNANRSGGHPTEKPVPLMSWCIEQAGEPQTILDPFGGSCTTAVAAKQLNRKCIIIEIEEKYCEIGAKRLSQEVLDLAE